MIGETWILLEVVKPIITEISVESSTHDSQTHRCDVEEICAPVSLFDAL